MIARLLLLLLFWPGAAGAIDLFNYGNATGAKGLVCVELIDPSTNDYLQAAPADWTAGTAPIGEVRALFDGAGLYANTTNQATFVDEGTACVQLTAAEMTNKTYIVKFRDSSGCPASCVYLSTSVYGISGGHPDAFIGQ